jgi:hypothetical protein
VLFFSENWGEDGKLLENLDDDADICERGEHLDREVGTKFWMMSQGVWCWLSGMGMSGMFNGAERPRFRKFREFDKVVDRMRVLEVLHWGYQVQSVQHPVDKEGAGGVSVKDGVLGYGEGDLEDTRHWEGNLFVFDDKTFCSHIDGVVGGGHDQPVSVCRHC